MHCSHRAESKPSKAQINDWLTISGVFFCLLQLATWDSVHGLNGSLKESRIENGMQGVTVKVVTLLVRIVRIRLFVFIFE